MCCISSHLSLVLVVEFVIADGLVELAVSIRVSGICELRLVNFGIVGIVRSCSGSSFDFLLPQKLLQFGSELLIEQSGVRRGRGGGGGNGSRGRRRKERRGGIQASGTGRRREKRRGRRGRERGRRRKRRGGRRSGGWSVVRWLLRSIRDRRLQSAAHSVKKAKPLEGCGRMRQPVERDGGTKKRERLDGGERNDGKQRGGGGRRTRRGCRSGDRSCILASGNERRRRSVIKRRRLRNVGDRVQQEQIALLRCTALTALECSARESMVATVDVSVVGRMFAHDGVAELTHREGRRGRGDCCWSGGGEGCDGCSGRDERRCRSGLSEFDLDATVCITRAHAIRRMERMQWRGGRRGRRCCRGLGSDRCSRIDCTCCTGG